MLAVDANILIRAVLGQRVQKLLVEYAGRVVFLAPDTAFQEAEEHLPGLLAKRGIDPAQATTALRSLRELVRCIDRDTYGRYECEARAWLFQRDEDDWPVLATALALGCPIWTEDADFFGTGVATWTTDRVRHYLEAERGPVAELE